MNSLDFASDMYSQRAHSVEKTLFSAQPNFRRHEKNLPESNSHSELGSSSIEFVGTFALILMAVFVVIQLALTGWAAMSLTDAARDGARLAASRGDGEALIQDRLADTIDPSLIHCSTHSDEVTCTVKAKIPSILPHVSFGELARTVTMPYLG